MTTPISEELARRLRVGDVVYITGTVITARDAAYKRALEYVKMSSPLPVNFEGAVVFHCGPLVKKVSGGWEVLSAGPTTSSRMEHFSYEFIKSFRPRLIVGKGGMGDSTLRALSEFGAAYGVYVGGAGALAASSVERVESVVWEDLGMPEAVWVLRVRDFGPILITMDSAGGNLHARTREKALSRLKELFSAS